jgi:mRNA-degrading endonuclease toxin of MazEF toxin-antitoxin module
MLKGEIWWADLPRARGSEPAKTRPVLIIQCDMMNRSSVHIDQSLKTVFDIQN